jgi:hypothetical protein
MPEDGSRLSSSTGTTPADGVLNSGMTAYVILRCSYDERIACGLLALFRFVPRGEDRKAQMIYVKGS